MKFTVKDLKQLTMIALLSGAKNDDSLQEFLRENQPHFCNIIDEVGRDPRCYHAYRFCTLFCATALIYAIEKISEPLPVFSDYQVHDLSSFITQKQELQIGRRASTYPGRIQRHVLFHLDFDEDDSRWLCTTISVFLVLIEKSS